MCQVILYKRELSFYGVSIPTNAALSTAPPPPAPEGGESWKMPFPQQAFHIHAITLRRIDPPEVSSCLCCAKQNIENK